MDLKSYNRWYDYSRARDAMFAATDTPVSPWHVVDANDKRRARLNCIAPVSYTHLDVYKRQVLFLLHHSDNRD